MTEQEREEAFAKEIRITWEALQSARTELGETARVTLLIAGQFEGLIRVFVKLYGKDKIDKYFPEEKDV